MTNCFQENGNCKKGFDMERKATNKNIGKTKLVIEDTTIYEVDLECESCNCKDRE
ncbi:MAG: hypothetical protein RR056_03570 [Acetivibrio sp.]